MSTDFGKAMGWDWARSCGTESQVSPGTLGVVTGGGFADRRLIVTQGDLVVTQSDLVAGKGYAGLFGLAPFRFFPFGLGTGGFLGGSSAFLLKPCEAVIGFTGHIVLSAGA